VDLHQVDPAAVPGHRTGQLHLALLRGRGPDLVGDDDLAPLAGQRLAEQPLGLAVHRGRIEQPDARGDRGPGELTVPARGGRGLEPLPGAQPDHRHADPVPAQAPLLHATNDPCI